MMKELDSFQTILLAAIALATSCVFYIAAGPTISGPAAAIADSQSVDQPKIVETEIIENRGDVVEITLKLPESTDATVTVSAVGGAYDAEVVVSDFSDGRVTLRMNTFRAGGWGEFTPNQSYAVADENDEVFVRSRQRRPTPITAGEYEISVTSSSVPDDTTTLELRPHSIGEFSPGTAPDSKSFDTASELSEHFSAFPRTGRKDWLVLRLNASGIGGYVRNLQNLSDGAYGASMRLRSTDGGGELEFNDGRMLIDDDENVLYVVFDTDELSADTLYEATFIIESDQNPLFDSRLVRTAEFSIEDRAVSFDRPIRVGPASDQQIKGQATVAPGTRIDLVLADINGRFFYRDTVRVQPDRTFTGSFDLSGVDTGRTKIRIRSEDPGRVVTGLLLEEAPETPTPTPLPTTTRQQTSTAPPSTIVSTSSVPTTSTTQITTPSEPERDTATREPTNSTERETTVAQDGGTSVSLGAVLFLAGIPIALYIINRRF